MQNAELEAVWQSIQNTVKTYEGVDPMQAGAFLPMMRLQAFSEQGFAMFTANSAFIKGWIDTHYRMHIARALESAYGVPFVVQVEVDESEKPAAPAPAPAAPIAPAPSPATPVNVPGTQVRESTAAPMAGERNDAGKPADTVENPTTGTGEGHPDKPKRPASLFSFENFVKGASNNMAYSMALAVAETPGDPTLNPLFIYGKSGLGKTHLLRAIQNYIDTNIHGMKTVYVDSMELVNDYTDAAASGRNDAFTSFKDRYENADVLLIDDVQGLQNKNETLNMVFQILNRMIDSGKQVVLAADRAPKNIDIEERYQSRFNSGGTCNVAPPEFETKLGIIKNFVAECNRASGNEVELGWDVQEYIANNSSSNIRELKSAITKVIFRMTNGGTGEISVREVEDLLQNHFSGGALHKPTVGGIQKVVEEYYRVSHADLVGKGRAANIAYARKIAVYLCRTMIDMPFGAIGEEFNRDHSTIMYNVKTIEEQLKKDRDLNEELEILTSKIREG
ncbi:MAG: chromosomal replication initiator protein DnaA [Coriobacteriaceae bacterium]|nr:chromosomal replication initiator protein DnaA [Coriobacteriaceae bacterium]